MITPRWLYTFAALGFLLGAVTVWTLRPPRCRDSWTYALPGASGQCPSGAYIAEHDRVVVCRCRPEPRNYAPESEP